MELVMLGGINKEEFLASLDAEKQEHQEESVGCKIEIFNPMPAEGIVDDVVSKKLAEMRSVEVEKMKAEEVERKKFKNAVTLTDIPATIKKAGFHPDGSPKMAIAGLFDKVVNLDKDTVDRKVKYSSNSLTVILGNVKKAWRDLICFYAGVFLSLSSMVISAINFPQNESVIFCGMFFLVGVIMPVIASVVALGHLMFKIRFMPYMDVGIDTPQIRKMNIFISTEVPRVPENVLSKIAGPGPFATLFEVTQRWERIMDDPVIFRIINIGDSQFFEPVVGYDMTPLEKKSLVEKAGINS